MVSRDRTILWLLSTPNIKHLYLVFYPTLLRDKIQKVFGAIDEVAKAVRNLGSLKQKGSAATYTAEFQRDALRTKWNDAALCAQYYKGLKDKVKNEIAREGKPTELIAMIKKATDIDNRLYERDLKHKGHYSTGRSEGQRWNPREKKKDSYRKKLRTTVARKAMIQAERQKHIENRTCFRTHKVERNLDYRKKRMGSVRPGEQRCNPYDQSPEAQTFVATEGNDINSDSTENPTGYEAASKVSLGTFWKEAIEEGRQTAKEVHQELAVLKNQEYNSYWEYYCWIRRKDSPYLADGSRMSSNHGKVTYETKLTLIKAKEEHTEQISFDLVNLNLEKGTSPQEEGDGIFKLILDMPCLNPQVDWRKKTILLNQFQCESGHKAFQKNRKSLPTPGEIRATLRDGNKDPT
ncbi:hypothetical protein B7494_g4699 [Chlorociboria aeruginascens]|nr:hypothetical protein B7494_g4699 [Chlorociboria aeruginascens]